MLLTATEVHIDPGGEDQCATVCFQAEDHSYFLLSRTLQPDPQDRALGLDAVYLELNDQAVSCYGGIASIRFFEAPIRFEFDERGQEAIRHRSIEIHHHFPPEQVQRLRQVLALFFDDPERYIDAG